MQTEFSVTSNSSLPFQKHTTTFWKQKWENVHLLVRSDRSVAQGEAAMGLSRAFQRLALDRGRFASKSNSAVTQNPQNVSPGGTITAMKILKHPYILPRSLVWN